MKPLESIAIIGGGTAGWMSAAYLNRALGNNVKITLVESSDVPTIGVGEATLPTIVNTLRFIGITEEEFLRETRGSYKIAIKYKGWATGKDDDSFYHPFFERNDPKAKVHQAPYFPNIGDGITLDQYWMREAAKGSRVKYDYLSRPLSQLADLKKFGNPGAKGHRVAYAYHLDAGLFAGMLKKLSIKRGVSHKVAHVQSVDLNEQGDVASVSLSDKSQIKADLFIDCTGFRSVLLKQKLDVPFLDYSDQLPCDRAVAIPAKNDPEKNGLNPYTTSTALSAGWSWNVPLMHRDGNGYVYSSAHIDQDQAESELRELVGPGCDGINANHIKMRVGRSTEPWKRNVVAMGLSANFIEPLESTAIFMIEFQLANLLNHLPAKQCTPGKARTYNRIVNDLFDRLRDFIVMHYCTTHREDTPFWKFAKYDMKKSDRLQEILENYEMGVLPNVLYEFSVFRAPNHLAILNGMQVYPKEYPSILDHVDSTEVDALVSSVSRVTDELVEVLPSHYEYLRSVRDGKLVPEMVGPGNYNYEKEARLN